MPEPVETLPAELLTLWPRLKSVYRLVRKWDRRGGIIFISDDDQSLLAARQVAEALGGTTIELTEPKIREDDYNAKVGKYLDKNLLESPTLFDEPVDRLCIIISRIDLQSVWLHDMIKGACEQSPRPFVLLVTCPDLKWMPDYLHGHLFECPKVA